jgi:hypothetical protein
LVHLVLRDERHAAGRRGDLVLGSAMSINWPVLIAITAVLVFIAFIAMLWSLAP